MATSLSDNGTKNINISATTAPQVKTYDLYDNGVIVKTASTMVTCASTTEWDIDDGECVRKDPSDTTTFYANPPMIFNGRKSTLVWDSLNADTCTGTYVRADTTTGVFDTDTDGDGISTVGSLEINPSITTDYTLLCENSEGGTPITKKVKVVEIEVKER